MDRLEPVLAARLLVAERFPDAVQAWLAGSVTTGTATDTSDLDIRVLLDDVDVHRESLVHDGWPVELFVRAYCERVLADGPGPLDPEALAFARYALADLRDDLRGGGPAEVVGAVAVEVWRSTAELLLAVRERWTGSGKWLVRELASLDLAEHTAYAADLHEALRRALDGDAGPLADLADAALDLAGGPLWAGYRVDARL